MRKLILCLYLILGLALSANAVGAQNVVSPERRVIVLDPGHGGPRPGKVVGKVHEADINLQVAKAMKSILAEKMPELEVYLTREDNTALHEDRNVDNKRRAEFANKKGADLLISIHANAADSPKVCGTEVWVLSLDEDTLKQNRKNAGSFADSEDVMHVENISKSSLGYIIALTNQMTNDPFNNTFARLADAEFKALKRSSRGVKYNDWTVLYWSECPGALVELGFMTNQSELEYMTSESGRKALAGALSSAVIKFIENLDKMQSYTLSSDEQPAPEKEEAKPAPAPAKNEEVKPVPEKEAKSDTAPIKNDEPQPVQKEEKRPTPEEVSKSEQKVSDRGFAIQLLSSKTEININDSQFKIYRGRVTMIMGTGSYKYKYCLAGYTTAADARADLAEVRKFFHDAYIVQYENGAIKAN